MTKKLPVTKNEFAPSRRAFLQGTAAVGAVAGVAAISSKAFAACPDDSPRVYPNQDDSEIRWAFLIDLTRCVGCQSCAVACKTENDVRLGYFRNGVITYESGTYPAAARDFVPWLCNHCADPPCLGGCPVEPTQATMHFPNGDVAEYFARATYQRPDGLVMVDQDRCVGCGACVTLCPYEARYLDPVKAAGGDPGRGAADKCTQCVQRLENGVVPACVNTCPHEARIIGNFNDPNGPIQSAIANDGAVGVLLSEGTEPRCFYIGLNETAYTDGDEPRKEAGLQTVIA